MPLNLRPRADATQTDVAAGHTVDRDGGESPSDDHDSSRSESPSVDEFNDDDWMPYAHRGDNVAANNTNGAATSEDDHHSPHAVASANVQPTDTADGDGVLNSGPNQSAATANDQPTAVPSTTSPTARRRYTYCTRQMKQQSPPKRRSNWVLTLGTFTEPKLRMTTCCKSLNCFSHVDYDFFMIRARHILSVPASTRRTILQSFLGADNHYFFNGRKVCVAFLKKSFHYSTELIAEVAGGGRRTDPADQDYSNSPAAATTRSYNVASQGSTANSSQSAYQAHPMRDTVVSFLLRLSEDCSEKMPDREELHLPFFRKRDVYTHFVEEFNKLYQAKDPPSSNYFLRVWKQNCRNIKVRKSSRFTVCDECDELRAALNNAIRCGHPTDDILRRKTLHQNFVTQERMEYQKKRDRARLDPGRYCSIIVDGADQSAFGLPHFTTATKNQRGHSLKVKLVGLLAHDVQNHLMLFTMTEEHATGANHIVESIHRFLNSRRSTGPLPRTLFVQLDNCTRENKNKYLMAYFEVLVALHVFQVVEVGFLPKGHTHEDIDQCFSQTSARLRAHNAITLTDLQEQLAETNMGHAAVYHLKRIANWSGLCDSECALRKVDNISQYRYFKFTSAFEEHDDITKGPLSTQCLVRHNCSESWRSLFSTNRGSNPNGILKSCPNLHNMPPLTIKCPDGQEKVTKRIYSEEGRINDPQKMIDLYGLRDFVFKDRVDAFHWNLEASVETEHYNSSEQLGPSAEIEGHSSDHGLQVQISTGLKAGEQTSGETTDDLPVSVLPAPMLHSNLTGPSTTTPDEGAQSGSNGPSRGSAKASNSSAIPNSRFTYEIGSFVVVRVDRDDDDESSSKQFWIGKVMKVMKHAGETFVRSLNVHWYDSSSGHQADDGPLHAQYYPCYQAQTTSKRRKSIAGKAIARSSLQQPWTDNIDTDTVVMTFQVLTKRHMLPLNVQKKLRP